MELNLTATSLSATAVVILLIVLAFRLKSRRSSQLRRSETDMEMTRAGGIGRIQ